MDFLNVAPHDVPKRSYQCLAAITIGAGAGRRGSGGSDHGQDEGITRILSGGRRRSVASGSGAGGAHAEGEGTWYWRCRAGVTADNLVLMPIARPPNPVLKQRPAAHTTPAGHGSKQGKEHNKEHTFTASQLGAVHSQHNQSAGEKITGFGRRLSAALISPMAGGPKSGSQGHAAAGAHHETSQHNGAHNGAPAQQAQEGGAETVPAPSSDANVPAETGWPGVIDGSPLQGIIIPLHYLKKDQVKMGGKDREGCHVTINIGSAIAGKSGHIRFEFDKDFLGGKAEAELLKHNIEMGVANASPLFGNVQLGGKTGDKEYNASWKDEVRGRW